MRPFLQAHWSHLCVISYPVPPEALQPHVPRGLALDTREGKAFVSLVAFDFDDTRVKGIAWPGYTAFPEINLRFYVKNGKERGVCFVREFVPKRLVSWVARHVYHEPYQRVPMCSDVHRTADGLEVDHKFCVEGKWQKIAVAARHEPPQLPGEDSLESFFIDQEWGYGRDGDGRTLRYRVVHPRWLIFRVEWSEVRVDWGRAYGPEWRFLREVKPCSTILAEGSKVDVYPAVVGA